MVQIQRSRRTFNFLPVYAQFLAEECPKCQKTFYFALTPEEVSNWSIVTVCHHCETPLRLTPSGIDITKPGPELTRYWYEVMTALPNGDLQVTFKASYKVNAEMVKSAQAKPGYSHRYLDNHMSLFAIARNGAQHNEILKLMQFERESQEFQRSIADDEG